MKILMMNIATNKYTRFVDDFYISCNQFFLPNTEVHHLLFTDNMEFVSNTEVPLKKSRVEHKPFPEPTLKRYHYFLQERDYIEQFDYVFYSDIDMKFVSPVTEEEVCSDLTLTIHPMIRTNRELYSYDSNKESTAFIDINTEGEYYFCGGFNGGSSKKFMELSNTIANNIDIDEEKGTMAIWHDESHLNRYAVNNPPTNIVDWCIPDWHWARTGFGKLVCLTKNHEEIRS